MEKKLTCSVITERGLIEAYVADRLPSAEAERLEAHYLTCDRCQREIRLALGIRASLAEAGQAEGPPSGPRAGPAAAGSRPAVARRIKWAGAAALGAAAVLAGLLFVGSPDQLETPASVHREEAAPDAKPTLLEPIGDASGPDRFRWTPVSDADLYRITLYDTDGDILYEAETRDTSLPVSSDMELRPGETYLWKIEARVGWDRWVSSRLLSFVSLEP